ncbi:hypothetical protein AAGS61_01270 [Lysinibacillus sp. KU-BSD001]|uniref:hypothetical protein n=1 Tax=Lysinibacillus sp. KU-BSD001 TaxID=3141328 RepID=UPI0036E3BC1F
MANMLTRYFFALTQTQLILAATISAIIATVLTIISDTGTVMLTGYFFAVGYITLDFFSIQEKYRPMLHTMPISAQTIVKMQLSYMLQVCIIYGGIFLSLFLLYTAMRADVSTTLVFTTISVLIGGSLLFFNVLFLLEYTLKSGSGLFLMVIVLLIMLGGDRFIIPVFKHLPSIADYAIALILFIVAMIGVTVINFRLFVRLYERRDFV